jgi:hypothetical protein
VDVPVQKGGATANFLTQFCGFVIRTVFLDILRDIMYNITQGKTCRLDYIRSTWIIIIINYTIIESKRKKCCVSSAKPHHISWINEKYSTLDMVAIIHLGIHVHCGVSELIFIEKLIS